MEKIKLKRNGRKSKKSQENFQIISTRSLMQDCSKNYGERKEYIRNAEDGFNALKSFEIDNDREHLIVFFLNTRNRVIKKEILFIGSINECLISPAIIFKKALLINACAILLAHNHPSDSCKPSLNDIESTKSLKEAGKLLEIDVLDHIVFNQDGEYKSLREEGDI